MTNTMRTGALYIRVSTHGQEELSPDAQQRLLLEYASKNNIIVSAQYIYEDGGISGRKADKRPKFKEMIAHAKSKEHPFDVILVWKFSRFARNQEESIVYKSMLKKDNVEVISVSEPLADGPFGSLIERIIEWMDEYYSIRLSGEVTRGMTENALRGNYQARPPLGYKVTSHRQTPVIVPQEAQIVQLIFDLYTEQGQSVYAITKYLNAHCYQTNRKKAFEKRSVQYILQNQTYIGKTVWNQRRNTDKKYKDKDEWIVADGKHEAIISEEQFTKAQERYQSEYHPANRKPSGICKHWLSGLLKCSTCGRTLAVSVHTDKRYSRVYTNFQCYGYSKGLCTVSHSISAKKLEPIILDALKQTLDSGHVTFQELNTLPPKLDEHSLLMERLADVEKKEERIRQAYRDGIDTLEEYKENKQILQTERSSLKEQLDNLAQEDTIDNTEKQAIVLHKIQNVYQLILSDGIDMQTKNEALKSIVEKIVIDTDSDKADIYFYLSKPAI